jgi:hypothetical protein
MQEKAVMTYFKELTKCLSRLTYELETSRLQSRNANHYMSLSLLLPGVTQENKEKPVQINGHLPHASTQIQYCCPP